VKSPLVRIFIRVYVVVQLMTLAFVCVSPPLATYDGLHHYLRALQISHGDFRSPRLAPNELGSCFGEKHLAWAEHEWGARQRPFVETSRFDWSLVSESAPCRNFALTGNTVYSPLNYAVPALGFWIARQLGALPSTEFTVGAVLNSILYSLIIAMAVSLATNFSLIFWFFGTFPFFAWQAASLSADGINYAVAVLAAALLVTSRVPQKTFVAFVAALPWLKQNSIVYIATLWRQNVSWSARLGALAYVGLVAAWWNAPYKDLDIAGWFGFPSNPHQQLVELATQPWIFLRAAWNTWQPLYHWSATYSEFGLIHPRVSKTLAHFSFVLPPLLILGIFGTASQVTWRQRSLAALMSAGGIALTLLIMWIKWTLPASTLVSFCQARYFLVAYLFLALSVSGLGREFLERRFLWTQTHATRLQWILVGANLITTLFAVFHYVRLP
jgi:hypothetical protein